MQEMKRIKSVCCDPVGAVSQIYITILVTVWFRFCACHF